MIKPSWVTSVPTTLSSSGPKLKSDQWRTIGSLYLPATLIRLWSKVHPGDEKSKLRQELLHLTMLLLSAISIASSRATSDANANAFLEHMVAYRQELQRLFPDYVCHPNHHMAMHIAEALRRYGPAHGWWAFPYERVIGMLQRASTNYKPGESIIVCCVRVANEYLGEYEQTIARSWYRSSNFRALFTKATCPEAIQHCFDAFETLVQPQTRDTLSTDALILQDDFSGGSGSEDSYEEFGGKEEDVSNDLRVAFGATQPSNIVLPAKVKSTSHIRHKGMSYTVRGTHEGNSSVILQDNGSPFVIEKILRFPDTHNDRALKGAWVLVRRHQEARISPDPFASYPYLRMKLWGRELEPAVQAVPISAIETHFAKLLVSLEGQDLAVISSLSRVSIGLLIVHHMLINNIRSC